MRPLLMATKKKSCKSDGSVLRRRLTLVNVATDMRTLTPWNDPLHLLDGSTHFSVFRWPPLFFSPNKKVFVERRSSPEKKCPFS